MAVAISYVFSGRGRVLLGVRRSRVLLGSVGRRRVSLLGRISRSRVGLLGRISRRRVLAVGTDGRNENGQSDENLQEKYDYSRS